MFNDVDYKRGIKAEDHFYTLLKKMTKNFYKPDFIVYTPIPMSVILDNFDFYEFYGNGFIKIKGITPKVESFLKKFEHAPFVVEIKNKSKFPNHTTGLDYYPQYVTRLELYDLNKIDTLLVTYNDNELGKYILMQWISELRTEPYYEYFNSRDKKKIIAWNLNKFLVVIPKG